VASSYLLASMGYHLRVHFWPNGVLNIFGFSLFLSMCSRVEGVFGEGKGGVGANSSHSLEACKAGKLTIS